MITGLQSQVWKEMAKNNSFNFYEVVDEAERYFVDKDKSKKGSGWKHFQRWAHENEPKFYPSGKEIQSILILLEKNLKSFYQIIRNPSI